MSNIFKLYPTYFSRGAKNFLGGAWAPLSELFVQAGYGPGNQSDFHWWCCTHINWEYDWRVAYWMSLHTQFLSSANPIL